MTVSSDDDDISVKDISPEKGNETNPLGPKPSNPSKEREGPSAEQLKIKTEASGMDDEAVEAALKDHTDKVLQSARAKRSLNNSGLSHTLNNSGLSQTEIIRRVRQIAADKGEFELIDFEVLDADVEGFDFSVYSSKDFTPDYVKPDKITVVPGHIFDLRMVKNDPEQLTKGLDGSGNALPINRWWRGTNPDPPDEPRACFAHPKSNTFVDTSADESSNTTCHGKDPAAATKTFTHFFMRPDRRSALVLELSKLHKDGAVVFHVTPEEAAEKRLFESYKKALNDTNPPGLDHLGEMIDLINENPENFFAVKDIIDELVNKGFRDPAQIVGRIAYDIRMNKPVILVEGQQNVDIIHPDPKIQAMLSAFDAPNVDVPVPFTRRVDNPTEANNLGVGSGEDKEKSNNGLPVLETPDLAQHPLRSSMLLSEPRFSSTPMGKGSLADKSAFFPKPPAKRSRGYSMEAFLNTSDGAPIEPEEYLRRHKVAGGYLARIADFPIQGRKTVGAWKALVRQRGLQKPSTYDYHPRYSNSPGFLNQSFSGEALPGVFRPCSSGMSEGEATRAFREAKQLEVTSLKELNDWVKATYPPDPIIFDPERHSIECEGYGLDFWAEIKDLNLARTGASLNSSGVVPHCPMDKVTTDQYFRLYSEYLEPLVPYVADTLLTTLGPSFATRKDYMWWSIPLPRQGGDLVLKDALFDYNGMSFVVNNQSQVGRCGVCKGLLVTPHHVTFLAYFHPEGLERDMVNASILQNWAAQRIAVCFIHAVTDAVNKPGRQLH